MQPTPAEMFTNHLDEVEGDDIDQEYETFSEPITDPQAIEDDSFIALESLAMEISELTASHGKDISEEQLLESFRHTIQRYSGLDKPALQTAINHLIVRCAFQDCGHEITYEQAAGLWASTEP